MRKICVKACGYSRYASHARAAEPNTATLPSSSEERMTLTLFLKMCSIASSIASSVGLRSISPARATPPKRIMASGDEKGTKLASAFPRVRAVRRNASRAMASPSLAASYILADVSLSNGMLRSSLGVSSSARSSQTTAPPDSRRETLRI